LPKQSTEPESGFAVITRSCLARFAVLALKDWLRDAPIGEGFLFRALLSSGAVAATSLTDREFARIFKRLASRVDAGESELAGIAGHSTRIGAAHDFLEAGIDVAAIANARVGRAS
jgi:hypothetical protein